MKKRSHPTAVFYYLGENPHEEAWVVHGGSGDCDETWSHVEEGSIAYHGNSVILTQKIELGCGTMEVSLFALDAFCEGTSHTL